MKPSILSFLILASFFFLQSCDKNDQDPYIIFKDSDANVLSQDTFEVSINSTQILLTEIGFDRSSPKYLRQINEGDIVDITDSSDVSVLSNGFAALDTENAEITTDISSLNVSSGSIIKTTVRSNTDVAKSIYYKVQ